MSKILKPTTTIMAYFKINPNGEVQKFLTNTCYRYMDKYVPMDTGDLRTIVTIGDNYIDYEMPYAYYQYIGMREDGTHVINPENYTTKGTGTYWDRKMWSAEKYDVINEVQRFIERG